MGFCVCIIMGSTKGVVLCMIMGRTIALYSALSVQACLMHFLGITIFSVLKIFGYDGLSAEIFHLVFVDFAVFTLLHKCISLQWKQSMTVIWYDEIINSMVLTNIVRGIYWYVFCFLGCLDLEFVLVMVVWK